MHLESFTYKAGHKVKSSCLVPGPTDITDETKLRACWGCFVFGAELNQGVWLLLFQICFPPLPPSLRAPHLNLEANLKQMGWSFKHMTGLKGHMPECQKKERHMAVDATRFVDRMWHAAAII